MIIWLASYPKSGNTWVRSFLTSILYANEGNINLNDLNKLGGQYPLRSQFKNFVKDFNNINEIKNEWINTQDFLNLDRKTKFPLKNLEILDIGCGGGLISEPMARLGGNVTGIDAAEKNINFQLDVKLNHNDFRDGEKMIIDILSNEEMFLTVYQYFPY